jgi:hypothetical protein
VEEKEAQMKEPVRVREVVVRVRETEEAIAAGVALVTVTPETGEPVAFEVPIAIMKSLIANLPGAVDLLLYRQSHPLKYKGPH